MKKFLVLIVFAMILLGERADAAMTAQFEISGWVPYWRNATGTVEVLNHIDTFKEINPFGYTVKSDGTLYDNSDLRGTTWLTVKYLAKQKGIRFIPSIMWSDGNAIHNTLKSPSKRKAHVQAIVKEVNTYGFDGIDIDYEAKLADTNPYFSSFIKELQAGLGKTKWLMCTIEARTPYEARTGTSTPANYKPEYANDYAVIGKYCDRVRIMAYDQSSIDKQLNSIYTGPYAPISDPRWVDKVLALTVKSIPRSKIMLGVATYGYEYEYSPLVQGYTYKNVGAFNPKYALDLASQYGITPTRNVAGELSFTYMPSSSSVTAAGPVKRILWWSDAQAIQDKVTLAKKYGLRGVSVFKIDGGGDPNIWPVLNAAKSY